MKGIVFNVQHYSVHDGPGIRTIVFLKSCSLRCAWCSNPESQGAQPEIAYDPGKCIGSECKLCVDVCDHGAITWNDELDRPRINFNRCAQSFKCSDICPSKAISVYGKEMTVDEVLKEVEKDMSFYNRSGGGVTFSGGEPLNQIDFLVACLSECKKRSIHSCIETAGHVPWDQANRAFELLDYVLYDVKHMDPDKHKKFTGVSNEIILENLVKLREKFPDKKIRVRTPVIPGFNDTEDEIKAIQTFLNEHVPNVEYELLKFHSFGSNKYNFIGRPYSFDSSLELTDEKFEQLKSMLARN